jgi:hypothetical protein
MQHRNAPLTSSAASNVSRSDGPYPGDPLAAGGEERA